MTHPSSTPGDARDDHTGRFVTQPNGHVTPLSPHMEVWRWHITMAASILFRATIIAASGGVVLTIGWLAAAASGPDAYAVVAGLLGSPLGLIVGFGLTLVLFSFILNGARHLTNDTGAGLTLKSATTLSQIAVWGPVVLSVLFWVVLFVTGRVSL